jgi:hypothetical protein
MYVTAAFAYEKQGDLELELVPGDRVRYVSFCLLLKLFSLPLYTVSRVISRENDTWWKGELNGAVGMFPASFAK